jgi:hypothetical protein
MVLAMRKFKYLIYVMFFISMVAAICFLLFRSLHITVVNESGDNVCIVRAKFGFFNYLKSSQVEEKSYKSFTDMISFRDELFIYYYPGKCGNGEDSRHLSCVLERKGADACRVYINSNNSLDCSECYE